MRRKLLIIDNSVYDRAVLNNMLRCDYDILEASNANQGLSVLKYVNDVAVVIVSVSMPDMNGYEALRAIHGDPQLSKIPIVALTDENGADESVALSRGACDCISRPFDADIIRRHLANVVGRHESEMSEIISQTDPLTGLYNRIAFFEKVAQMISTREPGYYIMACFDVDNFKVINDRYGNARGDSILRMIADIFRRGFASIGGIACRVMADNFAVLYPKKYVDSGQLESIRNAASELDNTMTPVAFSIGRYVVDDLSIMPSAMYDRAVLAEESVKGRVDVNIAYYDESMRAKLLRTQEIVNEMSQALRRNDFEIWFQPQYNHTTGSLIGAEALVRWRPPERVLISPEEFIPVFEKNGFIYELDKYVWERVCAYIRKWLDEGREPLPVSVNVSRFDILRTDLVDILTGLVKKYDIPTDMLRLEITESAFAENTEEIINVVKRLIAFGFTIEIDDFGSGYSSLNTLKDVPADVLKLDVLFLESASNSQRGGSILESIVRMARWIGMSVIAEGVETVAQANFLKTIGCNYVQGYLYAKPMPAYKYETLTSSGRTERFVARKHSAPLDKNVFWDPDSLDTLIFNTYIGAACVYEYSDGSTEIIRVNEKFSNTFFGGSFGTTAALSEMIGKTMDQLSRAEMKASIERALASDSEENCEVRLNVGDSDGARYYSVTQRVLARADEHAIIYATVDDITERRTTEIKKNEALSHLRAIMSGINGGVSAVCIAENGDVEYIFANDRYYEMLGFTKELFEREKINPFYLIHPQDREEVSVKSVEASKNCLPFSAMYRAVRRDGAVIWIRSNVSITHIDGIDRPVQIAVANDISDQVEAALNAKRSSERLNAIAESVSSGISAVTIKDGKITILFANRRFYSIIGYTGEEYKATFGEGFGPIVEEDRDKLIRALGKCSVSGESATIEYRALKKDGTLIWARHCTSTATLDGIDGNVYISIIDDITKEKESEILIRNTADKLDKIIANVNGGVTAALLGDGTLDYILMNERFHTMFGYTREQFDSELEHGLLDLILPEYVEYVTEKALQAEKELGSFRVEYRARRRDGSVIWARSNGSACRIEGYDKPVQIGVTTDITAEKDNEEQMSERASQLGMLHTLVCDILHCDTVDETLSVILERTLGLFASERAFVAETDSVAREGRITFSLGSEGFKDGRDISARDLYEMYDLLSSGFGDTVCITDTSSLAERNLFCEYGIGALVAIPFVTDMKRGGFLCVVNPKENAAQITRLQPIRDYLVSLISRRDAGNIK